MVIEAGTEPIALEGAVVAVVQGGGGGGAEGEQAGKRKRRHKLAQQPVRHSLWKLDSLEAQNEVLAGLLEGKVRALRRRKAEYDEARRLSDGSDSCWSDPDGDSDNESAPELDIGPPAPEEAEVGAVVVGEEVATLHHQDSAAEHRERVQREEQTGAWWSQEKPEGRPRWCRPGRRKEEEAETEEGITDAGRWEVATGRVRHQSWW